MDSPPRQTPVCCGPSRRASLPTPSQLEGIPAGVRGGGEGENATAHQMVRLLLACQCAEGCRSIWEEMPAVVRGCAWLGYGPSELA